MTTEHDSDPDATVKMPRLVPRKGAGLEHVEHESTLIREDWGSTTILPPQNIGVASGQPPQPCKENRPDWDSATQRRPAYATDKKPC